GAGLDEVIGLTTNSMVLGTPDYLAPEALEGRPVDLRADVYATGVMLYRMSTGSLPISGKTAREMLTAKLGQDPAPPSRLVPELPAGLDSVLLRALGRSPGGRLRSRGGLGLALWPRAPA